MKLIIMSHGVRIDRDVELLVGTSIKNVVSMRSGLSSGLDAILPGNIWVNIPINESFARQSELSLGKIESTYILKENNRPITEVELLPRPYYYDRYTTDGVPMKAIGSTRGDRLSIAISTDCIFWKNVMQRCKFCAIGYSAGNEIKEKKVRQILETVGAALHDPTLPAKHVYLNSGCLPGQDRGSKYFAYVIREIKSNFKVHIHLNPCPPRKEGYIDELYQSGLDEISFNIEFFDESIARTVIPGKFKSIGLNNHSRMLDYAVRVFGEGNVSSCLVVGLESSAMTLKGVEHLARLGVIPKLSCFRPTKGSLLENNPPPSVEVMEHAYSSAREIVRKYGVPLGPTCIPCQLHSLVFPDIQSGHYFSSLGNGNKEGRIR